jgi:hypothetical protein
VFRTCPEIETNDERNRTAQELCSQGVGLVLRLKLTRVFLVFLLAVICAVSAVHADGLVINEFLAMNDSILADEDGEYSDWIEIYNGSTNIVDLDGWFLSDDAGELDKWRIPSMVLSTGDYLVVFASSKDRNNPASELHTDFKLSGSGEYLALVEPDRTTVHHAYSTVYPVQVEDVSFGISTNVLGDLRYFATPTPDAENGGDYLGFVEDTKFTVDRGFYSNTFSVAISSETAGATIHYTTDLSEPDEISGDLYTGPVTVSNTTVLRAMAFLPGWRSTDVDTHTYLFPIQVLQQDGAGLPDTWGHAGADYEMDPDIVNDPVYSNDMVASLLSLPSMSLALPVDSMFGTGGAGIYLSGENIPRATSAELISPTGEIKEFQINCSVEIVGGSSVNRWKTDSISMRLRFKSPWGPTKLKADIFGPGNADEFDTLILDARLNNVWHYGPNDTQRRRAQYVRDQYPSDLQNQMGGFGHHCLYVHLYICGLYWGIHALHERPDESFAAAYLGGDGDDYDILKHNKNTVVNGSKTDYNTMIDLAASGLATEEKYQEIQEYLELPGFIDYMLVNFYVGNTDWAHQNWYASRNVVDPDGRWRYHSWDPEHCMEGVNDNATDKDNAGGPTGLHQDLAANTEYRLLFADHVHRHLFNDGLLTPTNAMVAYLRLLDQVDLAVIAESARWGDNRKEPPYTRDNEWIAERTRLLTGFFPTRTDTLLSQLKAQNMYPDTDAPVFARHGGLFTNGYELGMSAAETIYYTLDGTDPREYGTGSAVGTIYAGTVPLNRTSLVKTRARSAGGEWSALNEVVFTLAAASPLRVTEVMYNPRNPSGTETNSADDSDQFEFVELQNRGGGTLGLAGLSFTNGISFDFTYGDVFSLTQGEYVVIVSDIDAFTNRYGSSMLIAGEYSGSLGNGGERLALSDGVGSNLLDFTYNDARGWPLSTDGAGHSLVATDMTNQPAESLDYSGNWRASAYIDGSPGEADPDPIKDVVLNEIAAHTDYTNAAKPEYDSNDWIELYNTRTTGVSLANWYLSDSASDLRKWSIPATNTIASEGLKVFDEVSGFHSPVTNGFGLDKAGEQVFLSYLPGTSEDRVADCISFKGQENGLTLGRYTDGDDYWYSLAPTPAAANAAPGSQVVISEIMYHPSPTVANPENNTNDEYVKIYNPLFVAVDLWTTAGPWRLDGGIGYTFPSNTTIAAKSEVMIVSFDPVTNITARNELLAHYDLDIGDVTFLGPYSAQLDNQSDRVALEKPLDPDPPSVDVSWVIVDEVIYSDSDPWPPTPDGSGPPLYRADLDGAGSDPSSWSTDPPAANTFVIRSLSISSGTPLVTWGGLTNGDWYVERSTNLSDGFTRIATSSVATSYHDTALPSSVSESYYRIAVSVAAVPVYTRNTAGYLQLNVPSNGYSLVSVPFQKFPLYRGVVSSNTPLTITDNAASWTAGEFKQGAAGQDPTGTNSFYVEIRDKASAWEGKMFPVTTNSATELQIEGGSAAGLTADALAGASYAIVPEQRVRDIFGEPDSPLLVRGSGVGSADNILFWSGTSWQRIYNKDSGNPVFLQDHWLLGNTVVDDKAIGRDASFFLFRQATSNTVLHLTGEVPAYNQWIDLDPGYNLVGGCWIEPVQIGDTSLQGTLKGGGNSSTADAILDWGGSSWLGAVYYKSSGSPPFLVGHWIRGTTIMDSSFNFMPTKGYFMKSSSSNVWHKARRWND